MSEITDRAAEVNRHAWDSLRRQRDEGLVDLQPLIHPDAVPAMLAQAPDDIMVDDLTPEMIRKYVGDIKDKRVLDMGCGYGLSTVQWALAGARAVGVDNSGKQLEAAKKNADIVGIDCRFVRADLLRMPKDLLNGTFDLAYSSGGVKNWIGDLQWWFANVYKALRPGGIYLLHDGHPCFIWKTGEPQRESYFDEGPFIEKEGITDWNPAGDDITVIYWCHTVASLITAIGQSGLRITHLLEFPDDSGKDPDFLLLRAVKD